MDRAYAQRSRKGPILGTFSAYPSAWVKVRLIRISEEVQNSLDYPSKLSRNPELIRRLMKDGENQARNIVARLNEPAYTIEEATCLLSGGQSDIRGYDKKNLNPNPAPWRLPL